MRSAAARRPSSAPRWEGPRNGPRNRPQSRATRLGRPLHLVYERRYMPLRRSHTPAAAISRSSVSRSRVTIKSSGK